MLYPGYAPPAPDPWPVVMHYGVTYNTGDFAFDKHWYMARDMTSCPGVPFPRPPEMKVLEAQLGGASHAPRPCLSCPSLIFSLLASAVEEGSDEWRRSDVALTVGRGLFEATRKHIREKCGTATPQSPSAPGGGGAAEAGMRDWAGRRRNRGPS